MPESACVILGSRPKLFSTRSANRMPIAFFLQFEFDS
jgi:hypothetical protein